MTALRLTLVVPLFLLLDRATGQAPPESQTAEKPPYQRLLQGDDAEQAVALEKRIVEKMTADQYAEALRAAEQLLALRMRRQGADHHEAVSLRWQVERLRKLAALPADERQAWPQAVTKYRQALQLQGQGRYREALPLLREFADTLARLLGAAHPDTALGYNGVALCLDAQGQAAEALPLLHKALEICRQSLGEAHPLTAQGYNNVAACLQAQGKATEALPLFHQALAITRQALGATHPNTAGCYNNVASCLDAHGKAGEALPLYHQALAIYRQSLGEAHPDTAQSYNNVAYCLQAQGRAAEALPLYHQALAIFRQSLGEAHPRTATSYHNVAGCLQDQGKATEALPLLEKALEVRRHALGEAHPDTAASYNSVASCLQDQGKAAEALPLYRKALEVRRHALGEAHPHTATSYHNVAFCLQAQGQAAEALPLYHQALAIARQAVGEAHPQTARGYTNVAFCLQAQGKAGEALEAWGAAVHGYERARLRVAARGLDRAPALDSPRAARAAALARAGRPAEAWQALEADCARGLLDEESARRQLPPQARTRLRGVNGRLDALQAQQAALLADPRTLAQKQAELTTLRAQRGQAEAELGVLAAALSQDEVWPVAKVQSRLPAGTALLAWVDVRDGDGRVQEHWAALLRPEGPPAWARLPGTGDQGAWAEQDDALPDLVRAALSRDDSSPTDLLRRLARQRLGPPEEYLQDIRHLIVLPSPWMVGLPVEALTDRFTVSYAASGTQLARLIESRPQRPTAGTLLAVGDPTFRPADPPKVALLPPHGLLLTQVLPGGNAAKAGLRSGDVLLRYGATRLAKLDDLKAQEGGDSVPVGVWRDGRTTTRAVAPGPLGVTVAQEPAPVALKQKQEADAVLAQSRGGRHAPLPGTRREVEAIARLIPEATLLLGADASKSKLEQLRASDRLSGYRYLHLATHGEVNRAVAFSSALILADEQDKEDWQTRLTAAEIRDQWKLSADLVTLSACETGQGRQGGSEGLLGFSQALFLAGARSVVLSLWKVDDTATALLMQRFYQNLLGKRDGLKAPLAKAEALREAKAWLRELTADQVKDHEARLPRGVRSGPAGVTAAAKPYAHPYYWSAFILIGDPE